MNTKRQTVWLVSMLSLMVVLSAYYLFTQDSGSEDILTDSTQTETGVVPKDATAAVTDGNKVVVDQVQPNDKEVSATEQEVLNQVEAMGGISSVFAQLEMKRTQQYNDETDKYLAAISNTQLSPEESTAAAKQLDQLEDKNLKLTNIESELMKNYHTAIIDQENDRYKVVVESDKLEKSQAVDIIDLVMKTLDVNAEQVSVQFVP